MNLPLHIRSASDRCKELREELDNNKAIIKMLSESLKKANRGFVRNHLMRSLEKHVEKESDIKNKLFELEEDLTKSVLVEQFLQRHRINNEYSDAHFVHKNKRVPGDMTYA